MSAVEEYRKRTAPDTPLDGAISMQYADAAIAELEAENRRMDAFCKEFIWGEDNPHEYETLFQRAEQAEAERDNARSEVHKLIDDRFRALDIARARGRQRDEYQTLYANVSAELAALKGRRCEKCKWLGETDSRNWRHCKKLGDWEPPDFACNRWAERGTG